MFDVPPSDTSRIEWHGELPIEGENWNVGLIVGPSGSGKSTVLRDVFGTPRAIEWRGVGTIDGFDDRHSISEIAAVCQAVGFNTIPAWLRPYAVLSNGERFRAEIARVLIDAKHESRVAVVDEFTSVVDRQVAKIVSHAVQKHVRRESMRFVAASCHSDIIEWLQPDWILEMPTMHFARRCLQRRPAIDIEIRRVAYSTWRTFAPFHYLTAKLHPAARCYGLYADGQLASFAGVLRRPHATAKNIMGLSRLVTLPDYQGLGLAMILSDRIGSLYGAVGERFHMYPAHPSLVRSFDRSKNWTMRKKPGIYSSRHGSAQGKIMGGRPCAVFEYCGEVHADRVEAQCIIGAHPQ